MDNQLFGIITVIMCFTGYFFSWKFQLKENYKLALALLIVCGLLLRFYTSCDFFLHTWDERYHALVAKNLMHHMLVPTLYDKPVLPYELGNWPANHIWLHKQPLPLWTMAGSMCLFGVNEIALRLPSILMTSAGIYLTYYIADYLFGKKTAFVAAFLYSINGLIIEMAAGRVATDHIDVFFLFFIELGIFFTILSAQKKKILYTVLVGFSLGAAILCKWLPALIIIPVWLFILLDAKSVGYKKLFFHFLILAASSIIVFLPWQLYIFSTFPAEASWEASFNMKHITEVLDRQGGPFYYFLNRIRINYGELIYLPLIWMCWNTFKDKLNFKFAALFCWIMIPILFFSSVSTKMQGYILFTAPALFMITAEFWYVLSNARKTSGYKWLYSLIMVLMIALPARYCIERIKPFERSERNPQWAMDLRILGQKDIKNGVMFNYPRPVEAMFYTGLTVYPEIPGSDVIGELQKKGYIIIMNDDGRLPAEIRNISGIAFEHLSNE
ncbi:MAG: glycosyl transferase family 39 [Bacteroidetes bacterium]|nr:glycosyl transferase family 39 [Bacteroidota bacterium]